VRALVTGSSGYIGTNLCRRLEEEGIDYIPFDLRQGYDILDRNKLQDKAENVDLIYHLAAQVGVPECEENPLRAFQTNVRGTFNVLDCTEAQIIFTSSFASIYPDSTYGLTKMVGERLVLEGDGTVLRLSNVYGGANFFEEKTTVITKFINSKRSGLEAEIYGDGGQTRDFVHIDDVLDALMEARNWNGFYNVCTGRRTSIIDLAEMVGVDYKQATRTRS